ncbi:hypothetical protein [Bifidobacterium eulemuris]|uniref:Uncharacterized protein n=1 Tax=Bifidobacterium eulemuris TaxID=1765219 RepID=A0A261G9V6_9BIFI|nr:hypothetical protein [Bifidobacterium eulemuris]OZG68212.1 hypothetical protein BEUL_1225 [Bifidobacterium eulemuris]QOL31731.1 hypothetical protein BE0216_04065 [Bifidobacterium eulemuris]
MLRRQWDEDMEQLERMVNTHAAQRETVVLPVERVMALAETVGSHAL